MPSLSSNYPWQRRWLTVTLDPTSINHPYEVDGNGYVIDTKFGANLIAEPIGVTLEQLGQDLKCAVLLGEPGIGKSYEWE